MQLTRPQPTGEQRYLPSRRVRTIPNGIIRNLFQNEDLQSLLKQSIIGDTLRLDQLNINAPCSIPESSTHCRVLTVRFFFGWWDSRNSARLDQWVSYDRELFAEHQRLLDFQALHAKVNSLDRRSHFVVDGRRDSSFHSHGATSKFKRCHQHCSSQEALYTMSSWWRFL